MEDIVDRLIYYFNILAIGAGATLVISLGAFVFAVIIGLILTVFRQSGGVTGRVLVSAYVELFRNTPVLTQLLIVYFALVQIGVVLPSLVAAIIGFGLGGAASLSEVFRASMSAVEKGQSEAARSLGMRQLDRVVFILAPQGVRIALPSIGNYAIGLLKDTSLASAVAVPELALRARVLVAETYDSATVYLLVAIIYLILSAILSFFFAAMERRAKWGSPK